jgi:hypothetical protein
MLGPLNLRIAAENVVNRNIFGREHMKSYPKHTTAEVKAQYDALDETAKKVGHYDIFLELFYNVSP